MAHAPNNPPHMPGPEFRDLAHRMADWIADYWERVETLPVLSRVKPGETMAKLPPHPPEEGLSSWDAVFEDLERTILPGLTHWQHPNFYAYFSANASGPAVLGDFLAAGLGVQGMLWATSPACTEVEQRMMDWLGEAIGLPDRFLFGAPASSSRGGGVIAGTASESTLIAMLAARDRARRASGGGAARLVAYASNQAHSSITKAAMIAGIAASPEDHEGVRLIEVDDQFRMCPRALAQAMRDDAAAGRTPFFVHATVGTTGVTAVDPVDEIAEAVQASGLSPWLHVDAAHAGAACICPEHRWMFKGVDRADSICFNPHKWLLTNFDCGCLWVADRAAVTAALSITPEYLRNTASDSGSVVDYRDWHIPLGRRFRALKLWFVMRHYGLSGLRAFIRGHIALAEEFESWVRADTRFEVAAPRTMNLVCFRLRSGDAATRALMDKINASGRAFLTHTTLPARSQTPGPLVLRMAIGSVQTQAAHVRATWDLISNLAGAA